MISEIILGLTTLALLGYIFFTNKAVSAEREKMIKLLMARNLTEVTDNELVEKMAPEKPTETIPSDLQEITPDDDLAFDKQIEVEAKT